jgi:hypothetical protein
MQRLALLVLAVLGCNGVSKQDRIDQLERFESEVVRTFCEPPQPFRECFDVDEAGCLAEAKKTVHACVAKFELPDQLDAKSRKKYGGDVGSCAADAYEHDLRTQGKFKDTPKCNDPTAWGH